MMMPSRSAIVTVPVWTTGWPAKSLWAGTSVQVPFRALCSRAKAENAKRRVVKTAPVIEVVEYVLMISFQRLSFDAIGCSARNARARAVPHDAGEGGLGAPLGFVVRLVVADGLEEQVVLVLVLVALRAFVAPNQVLRCLVPE